VARPAGARAAPTRWQDRWDIDFYRLRHLLDQMDEANDYLALADMASRAGLPAEAQQVLDAGWAKGMLGKGPKVAEQQKFRDAVTKQAADDRQSLAAAMAPVRWRWPTPGRPPTPSTPAWRW
jgi:hypothetical protein